MFLKCNSGIKLSNYLRVPTVPETHQRLDPQRSANIYDISENNIVCPLHVAQSIHRASAIMPFFLAMMAVE
jgi:hypothetical protein